MVRGWVSLALVLAACTDAPRASGPQVISFVSRKEIPMAVQRQIDVLFVVDNSPAMAAHRDTVLAGVRGHLSILNNLPNGLPDVHLGFITTDVGSRGAEDATATTHGDCSPNGDAGVMRAPSSVAGRFIDDRRLENGTRAVNYDGDLAEVVVDAVAALGTSGCSFPRPLEAVRRALRNPANAGFVRDDALLAIVFLTPNDDCSFRHQDFLDGADPYACVENPDELVRVDDIADFVKESKRDPHMVLIGGAFGPADPFVADANARTVAPSCTDDDPARSAQPGVRLQAFFDRFPDRSNAVSLCGDNLDGAIALLQWAFRSTIASPCFENVVIDVEPDVPGRQLDCAAWFERASGDTVVPECDGQTAIPCFRIERDQARCPSEPHQLIAFDNFFPTQGETRAIIECVVEGSDVL